MELIHPTIKGFALGAGLIIAIGAQNAFILRQGLLRSHVFVLCLVCAMADALLIVLGIASLGTLIAQNQSLVAIVTWGGAGFLIWYGISALLRALKPQALESQKSAAPSLKTALATCLAFTFLNPHVYLDTVVVLGSLSARYEGQARAAFAIGAMAASFVWFFSLGYGARFLAPVFAKARAWQLLDIAIALVMFSIAISLILAR